MIQVRRSAIGQKGAISPSRISRVSTGWIGAVSGSKSIVGIGLIVVGIANTVGIIVAVSL